MATFFRTHPKYTATSTDGVIEAKRGTSAKFVLFERVESLQDAQTSANVQDDKASWGSSRTTVLAVLVRKFSRLVGVFMF